RAILQTEPFDVLARELGPLVDEHGLRRPARERLDRKRPGAGKEIEDAEAGDVAQHREQRLARAVRGRAHVRALRGEQTPAAKLPRDDPQAAIPCSRSSPKRARAASSRGA